MSSQVSRVSRVSRGSNSKPHSAIAEDLDSFLFDVQSGPPCTCGRTTFCPACGELHPAVTDPEVLEALADAGRSRAAARTVRKRLPA